MAVVVEMHTTGDPRTRAEVAAVIEHMLSDHPGEWRVSIIGSRENDNWELRIAGPNGFERSYTLIGGAGQHQPDAIRHLLPKLLPSRS
jgi:hypothetical protein